MVNSAMYLEEKSLVNGLIMANGKQKYKNKQSLFCSAENTTRVVYTVAALFCLR